MDTKRVVARFEAERQALALMDHSNIAKVLDAGATETGRPYFVMDYVPGRSITKYSDEHRLGVEQRLELFKQVCEGVHHAHQKGIIHRDLKPSNVLVSLSGSKPVPKIIDFGIAKAVCEPVTRKSPLTREGQLLGTPEFMSPEQVNLAEQDIDTRSDIYSLGVLLYELLAGVPPIDRKRFGQNGLSEIQRIIRDEETTPPSTRLMDLGAEAKSIAEKRRTEVATLVRRLHSELEWIPMKAMRKDRIRRYRSASELADDVQNYLDNAPLIAGPETRAYRARKFVRKHAGSVTTEALVGIALIIGLLASTAMASRAEKARTVAEEQSEEYRRLLYVHQIGLADASYRDGNVRRTEELLEACPNDLRGWEWHRLNHVSDQAILTIRGAERGVRTAILSPDESFIVSDGWGSTIKLWDAIDGTELKTLSGHEDTVLCVALSPDGKQIASGSQDTTVRLWDVETGRELATLRGHTKGVSSVRLSPDGKRVASAEYTDVIKIWDLTTGKEMANLKKGTEVMTIPAAHGDWVLYVAYSPDGKYIVSCGGRDPRIRIWDAATGQETMRLRTSGRWMEYVDYDSSGKYILSGGMDNGIHIWDLATEESVMTLRGHHWPMRSAMFSSDGSKIVSASQDRTIKLWDISNSPGQFFIHTPLGNTTAIWFSPDGSRFATAGPTWAALTLWDAMTGVELRRLGNTAVIHDCAFSPDGKHVVLAEGNGIVRVWSAETGGQQTVFSPLSQRTFRTR
jgi:WD40 repeat protein